MVIRDPETDAVIGEGDFRAVDAIEALLAKAGLDRDFDKLTEDEKQALIDAAGMIPGLGEGISALQAYEAALQAKAARKRGNGATLVTPPPAPPWPCATVPGLCPWSARRQSWSDCSAASSPATPESQAIPARTTASLFVVAMLSGILINVREI